MARLHISRPIAIVIAFLISGSAHAQEWRVAKIIGDAWVDQGAKARNIAMTRGLQLSGGAKITTGRNGKVVLVRGRESMTIGSGAKVNIPADRPGRTTIRQDAGIVQYNVQKRNNAHFEVRTPDLVALVKGTRFAVTHSRFKSEVSVTQGAVRVSQPATGEAVLVQPGQTAFVHGVKKGRLKLATAAARQPRAASRSVGYDDGDNDDDSGDGDDDDDNGDDDDDDDDDDDGDDDDDDDNDD